jgi:hypothetical protein
MVLERISAVHTTYQLMRSVRDCPEVRPRHPLWTLHPRPMWWGAGRLE